MQIGVALRRRARRERRLLRGQLALERPGPRRGELEADVAPRRRRRQLRQRRVERVRIDLPFEVRRRCIDVAGIVARAHLEHVGVGRGREPIVARRRRAWRERRAVEAAFERAGLRRLERNDHVRSRDRRGLGRARRLRGRRIERIGPRVGRSARRIHDARVTVRLDALVRQPVAGLRAPLRPRRGCTWSCRCTGSDRSRRRSTPAPRVPKAESPFCPTFAGG